jgi:diguanylate cyclase (GGDEF)-like protein
VLISPVQRSADLLSIFITDVTQTMLSEEQNFDRSHRDSLTGLFSKYTLDYHYGMRYRKPGFHAVYLDLDDFKTLNDQYGHFEGDAFLRAFAGILKSHQSDDSLFYRLGGDEFIGMIFGTEEELRRMAEDILARTRRIRLNQASRVPSVSIGIVCSEQGDDVIRKADHVMYEVKNSGKNGYRYCLESEIAQSEKPLK